MKQYCWSQDDLYDIHMSRCSRLQTTLFSDGRRQRYNSIFERCMRLLKMSAETSNQRKRSLGRPGRDAVSESCLVILVKGFFVRRGWMKERQRALRNGACFEEFPMFGKERVEQVVVRRVER